MAKKPKREFCSITTVSRSIQVVSGADAERGVAEGWADGDQVPSLMPRRSRREEQPADEEIATRPKPNNSFIPGVSPWADRGGGPKARSAAKLTVCRGGRACERKMASKIGNGRTIAPPAAPAFASIEHASASERVTAGVVGRHAQGSSPVRGSPTRHRCEAATARSAGTSTFTTS
jgi:hypothetical protein